MTYNGNANVIILGHGSVFEEIRSHVADLVAMNQVRRSFWICLLYTSSEPTRLL